MPKDLYKHLFLGALFALSLQLVHGQFNIVPLQTGNVYMKSQLWNLSLSNTGGAVQASLNLEMKDAATQQTVLSAMSGVFRLPAGVLVVQMQSLDPIIYNYSSGTAVDRSSNGLLPVGRYQVCYQLILQSREAQTPVADDCEQIAVEPLSPPLLTMPENDSALATANPFFTWAPPAPAAMFTQLNYDLLISELYDGQSITDAIEKNLPVQQAEGLQQPFFTYPLQGPQLEQGKNYVWQIIARDQQQYAAKSEVWVFRMPGNKINVPGNNLVYLLMDDKYHGVAVIDPGLLHIKYVSAAAAHQVRILLKDGNNRLLMTLNRQIRQGDNFLDISLSGAFQSHHIYTVLIQTPDGASHSLAFSIN